MFSILKFYLILDKNIVAKMRRGDPPAPPGTRQHRIQSIVKSKANAEYSSKQLWKELNMPYDEYDKMMKEKLAGKSAPPLQSRFRHNRKIRPDPVKRPSLAKSKRHFLNL